MSPSAISPISPPSPTLDKAGPNATSAKTESNMRPAVAELDASKLIITPTRSPKAVPAPNSPEVWSQNCTSDHMLTVRWTAKSGWEAPEIRPYGPLSLLPTASVLHYATECFEGMKAYRGVDGRVRLFRPDRNAKRFLQSAARISLPQFGPDEFVKLLKRFVGIEAARWIPEPGRFIYIRPTMIATAPALGMQKPKEALLYIITAMFPSLDEPTAVISPAAPPNGTTTNGTANGAQHEGPGPKASKGMRLLASRHDIIRAWPGGFGNAKVGANYGPSLLAQGEAKERGYDQVLWLFGDECYVTEAGGSNFFVLWKRRDTGRLELVTAPLGDGIILAGVTRASVLELVKKNMPEIDVVERTFTMQEIIAAEQEERLLEAFGAGTAFFIAPCSDIHFRGVDVEFPLAKSGVDAAQGARYALEIKRLLKDVMYGRVQHEWGVVVEEE